MTKFFSAATTSILAAVAAAFTLPAAAVAADQPSTAGHYEWRPRHNMARGRRSGHPCASGWMPPGTRRRTRIRRRPKWPPMGRPTVPATMSGAQHRNMGRGHRFWHPCAYG